MPALVTCRGSSLEAQWNVGSDDFVMPSFLNVVLTLLCSVLVMATLAALYISPECADDSVLPPLLYYSFFALLAVEIPTAIDDTIVMSISYRGHIWDTEKRRNLPRYIYIRLILLSLELTAAIVSSVAVFNPQAIGKLECNSYHVAVALAKTALILIWIKFVQYVIGLSLFLDPCGLFSPGFLQHLSFLDTADDVGETPTFLKARTDFELTQFLHLQKPSPIHTNTPASPYAASSSGNTEERRVSSVRFWQRQVSVSQALRGGITQEEFSRQITRFHRNHIGLRRVERRLRVLFCCLGVGGHRSRGIALKDIARALYTLFDFEEGEGEGEGVGREGVRLVLSDVIAGFKLVNRYQLYKNKRLKDGERLEDKFRKVTFDRMPLNQKPHYHYKPPSPFLNDNSEYHLLVDDMICYMRHAMGMYGWPLHMFSNLSCGLCQLASKTCCECLCTQPRDPERMDSENCCMCGVAAMRIQAQVEQEDIHYISMDNAIYKAPFAVVVDRKTNSVVVCVRGTLSIKDALTDMSYSMQYVEIDGVNETYVHKGMYAAANEIRKRLVGRRREEVREEAVEQQTHVDECEVDRIMRSERKVLEEVFKQHKDYQLIVSGHSLGAGVASVLALLLRKDYPDLHCFAFSPPGCVFSYPLANYSRKFTTSVVLGNDVVPRISFRSLLYLKQSVKHLLQTCDRPKCNVLFLPKWCGRRRTAQCEQDTDLPEGFEDLIVSENTTGESLQNAVFPSTHVTFSYPTTNTSRQPSMDLLDDPQVFDREISDHVKNTSGRFMPTFPPGKIYHLRVNQSAQPCCLGYCYPNQLEMRQLRNEDLCMIIIDRGVVEDHLPNHVLDSLTQFKKQCLSEHYREEEVERLREARRRERRERREARELSNTGGQWVFPRVSREVCIEMVNEHLLPTVSDEEREECASPREREAEESVHTAAATDVGESEEHLVVRNVHVHEEEAEENDESTQSSKASKFQFEQAPPQISVTPENPESLMPVQVPFTSPHTTQRDTVVRSKPNFSLPLRRPSIPSETRPNLSGRLLRRISRGDVTPGDRVLTVNARRGFKLKLIVPQSTFSDHPL